MVRIDIRLKNVESWNSWRSRHYKIEPDVSNLTFRHLELSGINLSNSNLSNTKFYYSDLNSANFCGANLTNSTFFCCNLFGANMQDCNCHNVKFQYSVIERTNFKGSYHDEDITICKEPIIIRGLDVPSIVVFDDYVEIDNRYYSIEEVLSDSFELTKLGKCIESIRPILQRR